MSTLCVVHVREVRNWNCVTQEYSPPEVSTLQTGNSRRKSKTSHVLCSCSLRRCEQQLQLLGGVPGRGLLWRGRGGPEVWRRVWKRERRRRQRRRQRELRGELGVKGQVQLLGRGQEGAGCRLIGRGVARFPGEEGCVEPLGRLRW